MKKLLLKMVIILILIISSFTPCYGEIEFTENEIEFIKNHPVIHIGVDPKFLPFEFIDKDGEYKGITREYLDMVTDKTGIKFEVIEGFTWPEIYEEAINGNVDVLPAIAKTEEREKYFIFSEPYYFFKRVIVIRNTETKINGIEDLKGKTVAVQKNSSQNSYLLAFSNINLSIYDSVEAAITAVANGEEDVFVGNLATTDYLIRSNGITNLKFLAFESEFKQGLHFGIRKDWREFVNILDKVLNSITVEEKMEINNKWIELKTEIDYGPVLRIILIIVAFSITILSISMFWILKLKAEIDKRKLIQIDLERAKHEAEEANRFKSDFMARMSHEIRTPLNGIMGMVYLLKRSNVSLTQKMYIDRIIHASNNMLNIINDILDFSKIEAGKVDLEVTSFSLDNIIKNVVNIVSYKIEEQGIGFKLSKDPSIPNWFYGDEKRIEQIVLNILNNGIKFTEEGEVSFDIRLLAKEKDLYHLSFVINDTGIGMTEEQLNKLFQPFIQGDISINRRFGGTGLGLSIVKNLLELMNGKIRVFSTEGEGTTFIIDISLKVDKEKDDEFKKDIAVSHFKNLRTIILEKSGSNMNLISSYLSFFGMTCELTNSEYTAINMLEAASEKFSNPFDLFILDYETPAEGGFKFIESLKNNENIGKFPKTIMLFPMMRQDLFDQLQEYEIDAGIEKPIIQSILFNNILDIFKLRAVANNYKNGHIDKKIDLYKNRTVLVVDDNKTNQIIAKSLLNQIGFDVLSADNGKIGFEIFESNKDNIELVLMDLHMPVMNGYESIAKIREISENVPIIPMTADVISGKNEELKKYGIFSYITKPFTPEKFIGIITDALKNKICNKNNDILNKTLGIRNLGGNENGYNEVLNEYYRENIHFTEDLHLLIKERNYHDAAQLVHKVKSSSGTIGAMKLYEILTSLQKSLEIENEEEIDNLYEEVNGIMKCLLEIINNS